MTDQLGSAYVKIRPDFTGFKAQTQLGVKEAVVGAIKAASLVFGARQAFEFGKGLFVDAARVQKSAETIRAEFGAAGQSVIDFADTAGLKLGIASHESEDAAARFGILFKNIGVGKADAAGMTVNLEKLAGSIAAIRGKDPGEVLGTLPLALSGSLRGLRQLGFAFTPVQEKNEALRLGLIKTTQQALDPGAKAIAIYGLVTQHLGDYQKQAAAHGNDAFNIQKRLSAEWDHAKETLGLQLLPQISKYGAELSDYIDKTVKSGAAQRDFNRIVSDGKAVIGDVAGAVKTAKSAFQGLSDIVGGDHNAIKLLSDVLIVLYARSKLAKLGLLETSAIVKTVGTTSLASAGEVDIFSNSLKTSAASAITWQREAGGAMLAVKGDIATLPLVAKTAETETVAAIGGIKGSLIGLRGTLAGLVKSPWVVAIALDFVPKASPSSNPNATSNNPVAKFFAGLPFVGNAFSQANKLSDFLNHKLGLDTAKAVKSGFTGGLTAFDKNGSLNSLTILKEGQLAAASARTAAGDVTNAIADGVGQGAPHLKKSVLDALQAPIDAAREQLATVKQQLAADIASMPQAITDAVNQAKQNLNSIGSQLESDIGSFLDKRGASNGLGGVLTGRLKELLQRIHAGTADTRTVSLAKELENQAVARAQLTPDASALKDRIARQLGDASDLFNKGGLGLKGFDTRIDEILKSAGVKAAVITRTQGIAAGDQFRADIQGLKAQAAAITAGPKRPGSGLEATIVRPLETLREQERRIADDQKQVARAQTEVAKQELTEQRKQTALLAKVEAKLPSKHESAQLEKLLRGKNGLSETAKRARAAGTNRLGR